MSGAHVELPGGVRRAVVGWTVAGWAAKAWAQRRGGRWTVVGLLVAACILLPAPALARAGELGPRSWPLYGSPEYGSPEYGSPEVSRGFSPPEHRYAAGHRGVDLPSSPGAPVLAAGAGRVTFAGLVAGRGVVVVSHGELRTTYEPVVAAVRPGAAVAAGAVLGQLESGHVGCPVPACLHWGLKRGPDYLDPVRWVTGGPVRLLPVDGASAGTAPLASGTVGRAGASGGVDAGAGPAAQVGGLVAATVPSGGPAGGSSLAGEVSEAPAAADSAGAARGRRDRVRALPARTDPPDRMDRTDRMDRMDRTEGEPSWSLRSTEAPLGAAALVALVAGIGLLARPRPPSPEPVSGGAATPVPAPVEDEIRPPAELLDLDAARARRRSG